MLAQIGALHLKSITRHKNMDSVSRALLMTGGTSAPVEGQIVYEGEAPSTNGSSTTFSFVVPEGVTSISVVCVGAGSSGGYNNNVGYLNASGGGGAGATAYANNISVTPGETLEVLAGRGGNASNYNSDGGLSRVRRVSTSTTFVDARGGSLNRTGGVVSVGTGGAGGTGGTGIANGGVGGGGGGAGGYSGAGGIGGSNNSPFNPTAGSGGGGGGGMRGGEYGPTGFYEQHWRNGGGGGGGVGLLGQGASGVAGVFGTYDTGGGGGGGSGGNVGINSGSVNGGVAGAYGGGGGGGGFYSEYNPDFAEYTSGPAYGGNGGKGAVRIIWPGTTRQFPSTNTGNV